MRVSVEGVSKKGGGEASASLASPQTHHCPSGTFTLDPCSVC